MDMRNYLCEVILVLLVGLNEHVNGQRWFNVTFRNPSGSYNLLSPYYPWGAPPLTDVIWELNGLEGSRIDLICYDVYLLKRADCSEGMLSIWDGRTQLNLCSLPLPFRRLSVGNKMFVQLRTGIMGFGRLQCVVQLVQADESISSPGDLLLGEPNSQEIGVGLGARETSCPCGWTNKKRIVGGKETGVNEFIFPVYIKFPHQQKGFCGGSIITRRHILTAAHCIDDLDGKAFQVVVGAHDVRTTSDNSVAQTINVQKGYVHDGWDPKRAIHDIAILQLAEDIRFTQFVGPVCLPSERYRLVNEWVKALGWGHLSTGGAASPTLQKVNIQVVNLNRCAKSYGPDINLETPTQICTLTANRDTCQGDSGGPLVYLDRELNRYVQVALTSYGKDCASGAPAVNTDVFSYFKWIQNIIAEFSPQLNTCEKRISQ